MAKENVTTPMPFPPEIYYKQYTDEKVKNDQCPKPPKIPQDTVTIFGQLQCATWGTVRPIEEYEFPRLHPQMYDRRVELKRLIQSVAVAFLDLLEILAKSPNSQQRRQRIDDLGLLFIHIHHMINEFRPHQARETLKLILEMQKKRREVTTQNLKEVIAKATEILNEAHSSLQQD